MSYIARAQGSPLTFLKLQNSPPTIGLIFWFINDLIVVQKEMLLVAFWYPNIRLFWQLSNKFHQKVTSTCYFQKKWIPKGHKSHFPIKSLLNYFAPKGHKYTQKLQTAKSCMQLIFIYRFLVHIVPYRKLFPMIYKCTMIFEYITISDQF